jgi:hypothetical protein
MSSVRRAFSIRAAVSLGAILGLVLAMPAWAKGKSGSGGGHTSCTDIPAQIAMAAQNPSVAGGVYGDGAVTDTNGNTVYTDGVAGVSAKFQVCNGSNDLVVNLINTSRYFWIDFSDGLTSPLAIDPGATVLTGPVQGRSFNVNEAFNSSLYSGNQLDTCTGVGSLTTSTSRMSYGTHFTNTTLWPSEHGPADLNCPDGTVQQVNDKGGDTSIVQVTVNEDANGNCSWTIAPLPLTTTTPPDHLIADGTYGLPVVGLVEQTKNQDLFAGEYNMPFTFTVTRIGGGCFLPAP